MIKHVHPIDYYRGDVYWKCIFNKHHLGNNRLDGHVLSSLYVCNRFKFSQTLHYMHWEYSRFESLETVSDSGISSSSTNLAILRKHFIEILVILTLHRLFHSCYTFFPGLGFFNSLRSSDAIKLVNCVTAT